MIYQKKTINNVPTKVPLSNSAPVGNPIGTIISTYKKIQPRNYLYCDGSTFDETIYPALYLYLGTNVLPDYRECAIVGAEKNTTDVFDSTETNPSTGLPGTQNHDVYAQGEFKDDQLQRHVHPQLYANTSDGAAGKGGLISWNIFTGQSSANWSSSSSTSENNGRKGTVTRGKRKAVYYYIKAVDGVDISDEDSFLNTVKNYVDEKNSYSTDEVRTGGTWIDGKPIYRKTVDCGALPNSTTKYVVHNITNIGYIVSITGSAKDKNIYIPLPLVSKTNKDSDIGIFITSTDIAIEAGGNRSSFTESYITIEYTKTTD